MYKMKLLSLASLPLLTLGLFGCEEGSASRGGGIGGTGVSVASPDVSVVGPVTAFGSVYVNGVRFDTNNSNFFINGLASSEDALNLGMVVRIEGEVKSDGTGTATEIHFDGELEGPVTEAAQVDPNEANLIRLSVLGVKVNISSATHFNALSYDTLQQDLSIITAGSLVEVSGQYDADGVLQASYIKFDDDVFSANETEVEIRGKLIASNDGNDTWLLAAGGKEFVLDTTGVDSSDYQTGQMVLIEGALTALNSNIILVSEIELVDLGEDSDIEIQGLITELTSQTDFIVDGIHVNASEAERDYQEDLQLNSQVEVEGTISSGVLIASDVEYIDGPNFDEYEIMAFVSSVDAEQQSIALDINGDTFSFNTNNRTEWEDERDDVRRVNLASLNNGDALEVTLQQPQEGVWLASEVTRTEDEDGINITAPVDQDTYQADSQTINVLGLKYTLDADVELDIDEYESLAAAFKNPEFESIHLVDIDNDGDIDELSLDD
ncbi:DUF5666 domain-containing protein [Motilimonas pumila]|uniref:DUF5666 domain-containing protein n=1 Tax=Motilimonas pumila TaxID=2303987 RepID=A0A418YFU1_9GAMM|nr:DUF5666 domain-containing protein [Motilimonas pumila]RJG48124.1 hypothetical protein D1Z90_08605 [Motilimonas pumila]